LYSGGKTVKKGPPKDVVCAKEWLRGWNDTLTASTVRY
jgi:hypothetical protein